MTETQQVELRNLKSEKLSQKEHKALKKWVDNQASKSVAAALLNTHRNTLDRILALGSCSPENAAMIRSVLANT